MKDLKFSDGKLEPSSSVLPDDFTDWKMAMRNAGYEQNQVLGDDSGIHLEVWEHDETKWIIVFNTATLSINIQCDGWANFIECLARLSSVVLAGMLTENRNGQACLPVMVTE